MQQPNEHGRITDPGEAHLMAVLWEAHRREQEVLDTLLPHLDEITQGPGESEREVLRRMFTIGQLDQADADALVFMGTWFLQGKPDPGRPHRRA